LPVHCSLIFFGRGRSGPDTPQPPAVPKKFTKTTQKTNEPGSETQLSCVRFPHPLPSARNRGGRESPRPGAAGCARQPAAVGVPPLRAPHPRHRLRQGRRGPRPRPPWPVTPRESDPVGLPASLGMMLVQRCTSCCTSDSHRRCSPCVDRIGPLVPPPRGRGPRRAVDNEFYTKLSSFTGGSAVTIRDSDSVPGPPAPPGEILFGPGVCLL